MKKLFITPIVTFFLLQCNSLPVNQQSVKPSIITEQTNHDTDDPAIWIHPEDVTKSLIVGTDKNIDGGLFVFDLNGKIVNKVLGLKRPNNVDIQYGLNFQNQKIDIAVTTERNQNKIRIYSLPDMKEVGAIDVFEGEAEKDPMGIALYKAPNTQEIYAIVGRKSGPNGTYLWQYKLYEDQGKIVGKVVRKFGSYSGKKEIEAIAVDNELGYIYYSDEQFGIRKYYADPQKGNEELALFGQNDFLEDMEGISIYKTGDKTGYILISNQQKNTFNIYKREGEAIDSHKHVKIAEIPVSTIFSDGSEVSNVNFGEKFPKGLFVAMSEGKVFHIYDWREIQKIIDAQKSIKK